jgi:hypothetical protein
MLSSNVVTGGSVVRSALFEYVLITAFTCTHSQISFRASRVMIVSNKHIRYADPNSHYASSTVVFGNDERATIGAARYGDQSHQWKYNIAPGY